MKLVKYAYSSAGVFAGSAAMLIGSSKAFARNNSGGGSGGSGAAGSDGFKINIGGDTGTNGSGPNFNSGGGAGSVKTTLPQLAKQLIDILLIIAGILAVVYLIWAGYQYITSAGSPDKAKAARAGIINAIIGIVIIVSAYFIIRFAVGIGNDVSKAVTT